MRTCHRGLLALSAVISLPVFADDVFELEAVDVVSTATRTPQPVKGVSASVQVITQQDIEAAGAQTLKDIFSNTPGLTLQYGTFPAASAASKSSVSLRGVGATGTLWLLDGRRLAGEVKNPYDMDRIPAAMIERIEIVKGPMSALYGADAVGGVINIITKQPQKGELSGTISLGHGSNTDGDAGSSNLSASLRGGQDKVRFSLNASHQKTDPYTERENTQTRIGSGQHRISEIPATPGFLNPNNPKTKGNPFYLQGDKTVKPKPIDPTRVATDRAAAQASFNNFREQVQNNVQDSYAVDVTYREASEINTIGGRLELDVTDKLTTGLEVNWFEEERDGTYRGAFHPTAFIGPTGHGSNPIVGHNEAGQPISLFAAQQQLRGRIPAWDVPVNSHDDNKRLDISADAKWQVGEALDVNFRAYVSEYEKRNATTMREFADFGYPSETASAASGMNANVSIKAFETSATWYSPDDRHIVTGGLEVRDEEREATVFAQNDQMSTRSVASRAAFLQDEWAVTDRLRFTLGGRYDEYTQDAYTDALGNQHGDNTDSKTTFRLGVNQAVNDNLNIRANIAQGFRVPDIRELYIQKQTPAGMQLGALTIDPSRGKTAYDLQPESTNAFEIGLNGRYHKLSYDVAWFHNDISDRIEQVQDGSGPARYYTFRNISEATTQGLEAKLNYAINDKLSVNGFWAELNTENKETGKTLEFTPERTVSAGLNWQASDRLQLGSNLAYTGEQSYTDRGVDQTTDSFTLLNINGSYALDNHKQWEAFGGIRNLTDERVDKRLGSDPGRFVYVGLRGNF